MNINDLSDADLDALLDRINERRPAPRMPTVAPRAISGYFQVSPGQTIASDHMNAAVNQGVIPFADAAARDAAIPAPTDGMVSTLLNTDTIDRHNGTAWEPVGNRAATVQNHNGTQLVLDSTTHKQLVNITVAAVAWPRVLIVASNILFTSLTHGAAFTVRQLCNGSAISNDFGFDGQNQFTVGMVSFTTLSANQSGVISVEGWRTSGTTTASCWVSSNPVTQVLAIPLKG